MKIRFHKQFLLEYSQWEFSQKNILKKIDNIIESIKSNPISGIGKPEKLKFNENVWSRRITKKDRLVYAIDNDIVLFLSCMGHYE